MGGIVDAAKLKRLLKKMVYRHLMVATHISLESDT